MDASNLADRMKEYEKRNQYYLQRGSACRRVESEANIAGTKDIISTWTIDLEMPILKGEDRDYVDKLVYVGEK